MQRDGEHCHPTVQAMSLVSRLFGKKPAVEPSAGAAPDSAAPDVASLLREANEHFRVGRVEQAKLLFRKILETDPAHAQALYVLGGIALNDGDTALAIDLVRRAISADPNNADYHFSLATVLVSVGKPAEAIPSFEEAIRIRPDLPEWRRHLVAALQSTGRTSDAIAASMAGPGQSPSDPQTFADLGMTFYHLGRLPEAEVAFKEAVRLAPEMGAAYAQLAAVQIDQGHPVEAERAARRATETAPELADSWFSLGSALSSQARHVEAAEYLAKAVELRPEWEVAWNLMLLSMNYADRWSAKEIYQAHVRWGQRFDNSPVQPIEPSHRVEGHRLRVGYLSPDYRQHPVAFFIEAPLKYHDRARFEIFCYHTDGRVDPMTRRLKALADHWRWMVAPSEQALEQVIREDGIDILVELSGHTEGHQLGVLARRVAPVQVTYLGYPNTTGLAAVDYRITDARADPPGQADSIHVEKLVRLPHTFLCYSPPEGSNRVAPPPQRQNGYITFGSFNNFSKLSPTVTGLWAQVLAAVPASRLLIKTQGLQDPGVRTLFGSLVERAGIDRERLSIVNPTASHLEHMHAYAQMDISLDTFPYHGTTTTLDALWMGVPVVTLAGDRHASRVGVSILTSLGLTELIAHSPDEYVAIAVRLAGDPARLEELRQGLRERLAGSALTNGKAFTSDLEQAYQEIWSTQLGSAAAH